MDKKEIKLLTCTCDSLEHTIRVSSVEEDGHPEMYIEVFVIQYRSIWSRIKVAIKYIFGVGHPDFDTFIFNKKSAIVLRDVCDDFLKRTNS